MKQGIAERSKELSAKVLTNILVLATVAKDPEGAAKDAELDLWDSVENSVIVKMREMELGDLVNLMWSALEVNKGSRTFFSAKYKMSEKNVFRATYFYNKNPYISIKPSYALGYNRELNKTTYGLVASTGGNNGGFRLGANLAVQLGFLQLYTALDDLSSIGGKVQDSNTANFRFGMNFLFRQLNKSKVKIDNEEQKKEELLEENNE